MNQLRWVVAAALSAWACHLAVQHATPIDRALPLLALGVTVLAAVSYAEVMVAVPLLIVTQIAIPDETVRLLAIGLIWSAATVVAAGTAKPERLSPLAIAAISIVVLRWIPLEHVRPLRELLLLGLCLAIVHVLGRTPFAIAIGVLTALVTPAVPLRTLALPVVVLAIAFFVPRVTLAYPSAIVLMVVMLFFPWSGVMARAFPYLLERAEPRRERWVVNQVLPANATLTLDVPERTRALILSGANVSKLRRGTRVARIEPGGIDVRIGDVADWGSTRRETFYGSKNRLPRDSVGIIRGYGYEAWVDGAGRVAIPEARTIRIARDAALPPGASLQVEGFELE
ncbi:MAG TPA: hypothetical protein VHK90_09420 [Thermoanaerobaculia bacterium]|nr:hypothetical protein [Thermoanaerobaculia bacterium]